MLKFQCLSSKGSSCCAHSPAAVYEICDGVRGECIHVIVKVCAVCSTGTSWTTIVHNLDLQTWIKNLGNFDVHLGRELVPQNGTSKLNHELLGDGPLENLDTWINVFLYKHGLRLHRAKRSTSTFMQGRH